ncbi:DUF6537 domain-containing protein, partial [Rhizobiaceae sp. 2RAB30]
YRISYNLAPPLFARVDGRTGRPGKMAFGRWIEPAFWLLTRLKGLRGTALDPFGRTTERRMERRLIADYFGLVDELSGRLTPTNIAGATELARLPEEVRGYGHVKHAAVDRYEKRKAALIASFDKRPEVDKAA